MRLYKSAAEVKVMKEAAEISAAAPRLPLVSFGDVEAQMNTEELRWPEIGCSLTIAHDITKAKGE
jgi:hypothetical protein